MRRLLAMMVTTGILVAGGCAKSYDIRLEKTLQRMKYEKRLKENLIDAPKGKFETLLIYLRPPKNLVGPTKEFQLTALEPDRFDLSESFFETDKKDNTEKQRFHVLARVKKPKAAAKKKAAAKAEPVIPPVEELGKDVVAILNNVYGVELDYAKAKEVTKKEINVFRHLKFEGNGKVVQLYVNLVKGSPYGVAIIFEYPKAEEPNLISKIELCLESFATGERARKAFAGSTTEEEGGEATPSGPIAF